MNSRNGTTLGLMKDSAQAAGWEPVKVDWIPA